MCHNLSYPIPIWQIMSKWRIIPIEYLIMLEARLLARVRNKKKQLDASRPLPAAAVQRLNGQLTLEWIYNSNAIEGSTLTGLVALARASPVPSGRGKRWCHGRFSAQ
jgi:hypothetical protein